MGISQLKFLNDTAKNLMLPFSSSTSIRSTESLPISPASTNDTDGRLDVKTIHSAFFSLKVLGFVAMRTILQGKLFSEQYQLNTNDITKDIEYTISQLGFHSYSVKIGWVFALDEAAITTLLTIIDGFDDNKSEILDVFVKGSGLKSRSTEIQLASIMTRSEWGISSRIHILTKDGLVYLKDEGFLYDNKSTLITRKELLALYNEELKGLDLCLQDRIKLEGEFMVEFEANWANLLHRIGSHLDRVGYPIFGSQRQRQLDAVKRCNEIIVNGKDIKGDNLKAVLDLIAQVDGISSGGGLCEPMWIYLVDLLKIDNLGKDDVDLIFNYFATYLPQINGLEFHTKKMIADWFATVILPRKIAAANTSAWSIKNHHQYMGYGEVSLLLRYVASLKNVGAFIDQNRGFVIQLLCKNVCHHNKVINFFAEHAAQFVEICFLERLHHDLTINSTINLSPIPVNKFDLGTCHYNRYGSREEFLAELPKWNNNNNSKRSLTEPQKANSASYFEQLPTELQNKIHEMLSFDLKDQLSLASTNKYLKQLFDSSCAKKLNTNTAEVYQLISEFEKCNKGYWSGLSGSRGGSWSGAWRWDGTGTALSNDTFHKPALTFIRYPQYRKPPYITQDLSGLQFLVYGLEVMGPLTIEKIEKGELTLLDAMSLRLSLEDTLKAKKISWQGFDVIEKYRLDGSLTEDMISTMTEQAKKNLSNHYLVELINFRFLSIERALVLTNDEVECIAGSLKHRNVSLILGVEQCLSITEALHQFILKSEPIQNALMTRQLTLKQVMFLFHLCEKHKEGWDSLRWVIRPKIG